MSDFKITWVGSNYAVDVTAALAGVNNALPEPERTEMTDFEKMDKFFERWNNAKESGENEDKHQL